MNLFEGGQRCSRFGGCRRQVSACVGAKDEGQEGAIDSYQISEFNCDNDGGEGAVELTFEDEEYHERL
jgi:hypothetical protein